MPSGQISPKTQISLGVNLVAHNSARQLLRVLEDTSKLVATKLLLRKLHTVPRRKQDISKSKDTFLNSRHQANKMGWQV